VVLQFSSTTPVGAIGAIAPHLFVVTTPILSAVVAPNCLMLIKSWTLGLLKFLIVFLHMFVSFGLLLCLCGQVKRLRYLAG
jgi:hypothetical protein